LKPWQKEKIAWIRQQVASSNGCGNTLAQGVKAKTSESGSIDRSFMV
jgi:hypothetical protein